MDAGGWPSDEDALTRRFAELAGAASPPIALGIGDDCAVLRPDSGEDLLWSIDSQEEEVDFRREWMTLEEIGARAAAAALSDLAGSGARPLAILLSLGSAAADPAEELLALFRGAARIARSCGAAVVGGDVTRRARGVGVTVAVLGSAPRGAVLLRRGARPGDGIWVTGSLGLAAAGLSLLRDRGRSAAEIADAPAVERFVRPAPRIAEALWLRERGAAHAMLDLSDGLARDLSRLCAASGVGAVLEAESVLEAAAAAGESGLQNALHGGEDLELLLSAGSQSIAAFVKSFTELFGVGLTRIGEIRSAPGLYLRRAGREAPLIPAGWDHVRAERAAAPARAGSGPADMALNPKGATCE